MSLRRLVPLAVVVLLLVLLISVVAAGAAGSKESYYVSIPSESAADAAALGLNPEIAFDYGAYHWLVLGAADFSRLAASDVSFEQFADGGTVQITGYRFDPLAAGEPAVPAGMTADGSGAGFRLVQFYGPINDAWLADLEASGLRVLQYYPHFSYLVWGTAAQVAGATEAGNIRWSGPVHPAYKMNSDLQGATGVVRNVSVFYYNDGNVDGTVAALEALGANVLHNNPAQPDKAFYDAIVELDAAQFSALAKLDTVLWFGFASPEAILDDEMSSQINAGNYVAGVPFPGYFAHLADLGFDGSGVTWAIIDTGVDYNHPDLGPHIVGGYTYPGACNTGNPGEDCPVGGHGTHVAGIVGGDATAGFMDPNGYLYGLGVAPGYGIFASNSLSASAWPPAGGWQEHSKRAVLGGAIGGNNSWTTGEGTNHGYQSSERTHDIMVLDGNFDTVSVAEPFIEVFSAGNSGPGSNTLTAPKEAKNLIIVASSRNFRVGNIDTISSFSSRGPAADGRKVPTIATPGEQISSSRNDTGGSCSSPIGGTNNMYAFCSGTSMAAPHASGSIALATEWWRSFNAGADPSSAMAKALMVNGAIDMATADIWNNAEGWGRINVTNVISPSAPTAYWDLPVDFGASGESWTVNASVVDPSKPVKITLAWADAPGSVGANPALVNNLHLTAVVGGTTYLGNVFSAGWSTPGGSADNLNNLENVYVQSPSGDIEITIDAANIAGDAILYNADPTDQSFALVCYNCGLGPDFTLSAQPSEQSVCAPANALYTVDVGSIMGFNNPVTMSTDGAPAGTTSVFNPNPVNPPGSTTLTVGNTGSAAPGSYNFDIVGTAAGPVVHSTPVGLTIADAAPAAPTLVSPANGATDVPVLPTFTWNPVAQAESYYIEIATDSGFTNIVDSATVSDPTYTPAAPLNGGTTYYWHVSADNVCGAGNFSATWSFTTFIEPGRCDVGYEEVTLVSTDFSGAFPPAGWTVADSTTNCVAPGVEFWTNTDPGARGNLTGGSGSFAIADSDICDSGVSMNTEMWTPSMDMTDMVDPRIVFNYDYNDFSSDDFGYLDVSTDGGGSWSNEFTWSVDDRGPATYDEAMAGAGFSDVIVRWHYVSGWDWWWQVDEVAVTACAPTGGGEEPNIFVDPLSLSSTQNTNTVVVQTLDIENTGDADLDWDIYEDNSVAPVSSPERLGPTTPVSGAAPAIPTDDVIQDGGFEQGTPNPFWDEFSTNFGTPLCDAGCGFGGGTGPHSGSWWVWFGGISGVSETGYVDQDVVIPVGTAVLSFWLEIPVADTTGFLNVEIDNDVLATYTEADQAAYATYQLVAIDVSAYADGGSHNVEFYSITDAGAGPLNFFVDDVVLDSQAQQECDAADDIPWLSVNPDNGTTAPGNTATVDVTFDSTGLAAGTYNANLCVSSNDPDPGPGNETELVVVPVELTVEQPTDVSLSGISGEASTAMLPLMLALLAVLAVGFGLIARRRSLAE